ncbi:glycinol 4-dimethylallyltransferase-like isoform X2 [Lotus japonicus]|uniref:glycinol 4-dimethylallyltransferase-like isoform X2 n=1 Tax=Lotus japonicus TaxID=34305 RepID=UPI0025900335|nr:glycinol 4-dimethylallyltransferase-like isoform X2 [Lotus japonicus]
MQTLCTISASLLAVKKLSDISPLFFKSMLTVIICHRLLGTYLTVVNQLFDIEIDKINKPYLPLASGQLSYTTGVIIATSSLIMSFWLAWSVGSWPLIWNILVSGVIWTAYSINVPLLRWKGNPVLAAMCYIVTMAFSNPIGDFLHMQTFVFKRPAVFPRGLDFFLVFMSLYIVGIAALKDIPDIEGDKAFGIHSLSTHFGPKRVFWFCVSILEMAFGVGLLVGATSSCQRSKIITVLGHVALAFVLWCQAKAVDLKSKASISSFYMFTWKLLYAEYFLMQFF